MLKLNKNQKLAIESIDGPVLVVAGAGTGKTFVIIERIRKLLGRGVQANRLLALTFTEKAAAEMLDRVNTSMDSYELELPIMTFNAYGESVLRQHGADIGLSRNFTVIGDSAQIVFLRERLDELKLDYFAPVSRPDALLGDIAAYFSLLKQNVIDSEDYQKYAASMPSKDSAQKLDRIKHIELSGAYAAYLRLCRHANVVDYDDQIYLVIELFKRRPNVLRAVQDKYDFVMVDEFQDTNKMQSVLVDMIAERSKNPFVVGDDDQSIYGWRGATLANILEFKSRYPEARSISLVENYRSTKQILEAAYRLIQNNNPNRLEKRLNISKRLITSRTGPKPHVYSFSTLDEELSWVAEDIKRRIDKGAQPGSIAVLARRNTTIQILHEQLDYIGVEHVMAGQRYALYRDPTVRMIIETLRTIVDPLDNTSLFHTLTGQLFALPINKISSLASSVRRTHANLQDLILKSSDKDLKDVRSAIEQIKSWRGKISTATVGQLTYEILDSSGYKQSLYRSAESDAFAATAVSRLSELFKTMREFEQVALLPSATAYIESLPALQAAGDDVEDSTLDLSGQMVNILTVHKSKGLEWPVVYIVDCSEGSFPLRETSSGITLPAELNTTNESQADSHQSEERRLMYVAMTRAKDRLILTHADKHSSNATRKPSRFLTETFDIADFKQSQPQNNTGISSIGTYSEGKQPEVKLPPGILNNDETKLTVSQIQTYLNCPLEFYYRYVLNIPEEPTPALQYGLIMHGLIENINRSLVSGKKLKLPPLQKQLEKKWPKLGYISAVQRERAMRQAQKTLESFYNRTDLDQRRPITVEESFTVRDSKAQLTIKGRFDAVFPGNDGVEIVDYKTSTTVDTPDKAKSRASSSQQLSLYALAWQKLHGELPALLTLDFVDTGQKGSVKKTQRGVDGIASKLEQVAEGIRNHKFNPGKNHRYCSHPPV